MCANAFERLFHLQITKSRSLKAQSFTSTFHAQEGNSLHTCFIFFFRFEAARNDQVELQVSIFTFLSHSPRPWRAHGGVWSQMTGWAASGCKEDCRRRLLAVFGNWWPIVVLPSLWRAAAACVRAQRRTTLRSGPERRTVAHVSWQCMELNCTKKTHTAFLCYWVFISV